MKKRLFMIPSLIAAGLFPQKAGAVVPGSLVDKKDPKPNLMERFRLQHKYTLAGHRSHSSHSSHSSHRSSSGGGYSAPSYYDPSPTYSPPSPSYRAPATPSYSPPATRTPSSSNSLYDAPASGSSSSGTSVMPDATVRPTTTAKVLPGNSDKFQRIVMQVQTALAAYGYYSGTVDGRVGPSTRAALSSMQSDYGLKVTGTVTPQTLDALRIVAE